MKDFPDPVAATIFELTRKDEYTIERPASDVWMRRAATLMIVGLVLTGLLQFDSVAHILSRIILLDEFKSFFLRLLQSIK